MYYVYILEHQNDRSLYKGSSADLQQRLKQHHQDSVYTTSKKDGKLYQLVWYAAFKTESLAIKFEKYLKSGSGIAFTKKHLITSIKVDNNA